MAESIVHVKSLVQRGRDTLVVSPLLHKVSLGTAGWWESRGSCLKFCASWKLQVLIAPGSHSGYAVWERRQQDLVTAEGKPRLRKLGHGWSPYWGAYRNLMNLLSGI